MNASKMLSNSQRQFAQTVADLAHANPFLPQRIELERAALGSEFDERYAGWNVQRGPENNPNQVRLLARAETALRAWHERLSTAQVKLTPTDQTLYEDLLLCVAYHRMQGALDELIAERAMPGETIKATAAYRQLNAFVRPLLTIGDQYMVDLELPRVFSAFFQIRRAFANIYQFVIGSSRTTTRLRATIWQSIFTHDLRRYRRVLYDKMHDYVTLVTGPSGTGKELVAQAVGRSRYVLFDAKSQRFEVDFSSDFSSINLSAMSPTLIESELFGHRKGAYTGAAADRVGWFEACPSYGSVFLDEIGELDPALQVKLLRVLQTRTFARLGDTQERTFSGKLIAATNRDLAAAMSCGEFREDLYYRLCGDVVSVPSLRERIVDDPQELHHLILHIAGRLVGDEAARLAAEAETYIEQHLGPKYAWPGNIRELEQCVRNIVIRSEYRPVSIATAGHDATLGASDPCDEIAAAIRTQATADDILRMHCTWAYRSAGSYEAAAKMLGLDRRTIKAKLDTELLLRWQK